MVAAQLRDGTDSTAESPLCHLLERLADNKYWLGKRYAEWCTSAPTLESAVAAAAMAQDEIGHARSHYPLLRHFTGVDVEPESRGEFHSMAILDSPFQSWTDFVAANILVDTALTTLYLAATESTNDDLRNRARRIVGEEQLHWLHARGWVRRLSGEGRAIRSQLAASLSAAWPHSLTWFGPEDDPDTTTLQTQGILSASSEDLRTSFRQRVLPTLEETGIAREIDDTLAAQLPWSRWNRRRFRLEDEEPSS